MKKTGTSINFDGAGNFFNKYESRNPFVRYVVRKNFDVMTSILYPVKAEIRSAFEIGCGEGYVTSHIHRMGIPIAGSDISSRIIEIAKTNNPDIKFSVLSIYDLNTITMQYDLIVANEVFEHLSDPDNAIEQIKKIAGKYILISVPSEPYFKMANILRLKYLKNAGNPPGHINHWSKRLLEQFLISHGLIIKKIECSPLWILALCEKY